MDVKKSDRSNEVHLKIQRYNPKLDKAPYYQEYVLPLGEEKISLLQGLESIYKEQDDTLAFRRYCCGVLYCNSCLMLVNGKKVNACLHILEPDTKLEIAPLPGKRVLRDLMVEEAVAEKD